MAQIRLTYFQNDAILKFHCESRGITSKNEDQNGFQKRLKKLLTNTTSCGILVKLLLRHQQQSKKVFKKVVDKRN